MLPKFSWSIFLIDHAWTYRIEHARQQLLHVPGLLHRMANLMGIDFHGEIPDEGSVEQVLQEMWKYNQTYQLSQGVSLWSLTGLLKSSGQPWVKTFQYMGSNKYVFSTQKCSFMGNEQ